MRDRELASQNLDRRPESIPSARAGAHSHPAVTRPDPTEALDEALRDVVERRFALLPVGPHKEPASRQIRRTRGTSSWSDLA
jgi:hypothetical protein